jgi:ribosomal protein S18 acetylase RimI-like enzyme
MPEIEIRPAAFDDVESLSLFEHGYYSDFVWQMGLDLSSDTTKTNFRRTKLPRRVFVPYPRKKAQIFKEIEHTDAFLVAVLANRPVGYIKFLVEHDSMNARVTDLVVSASSRRQGIASGLLYAAMDVISHRNYFALILEIQSKNDPAITMAGKLAFKFCGFRDHYFPNNELALFFSRFVH